MLDTERILFPLNTMEFDVVYALFYVTIAILVLAGAILYFADRLGRRREQ